MSGLSGCFKKHSGSLCPLHICGYLAVINHINFSTLAVTITWIYGARLENTPDSHHKVKGHNSFAFSDMRYIIVRSAMILMALETKHKNSCEHFVDAPLPVAGWFNMVQFR